MCYKINKCNHTFKINKMNVTIQFDDFNFLFDSELALILRRMNDSLTVGWTGCLV